MKLHTEASRHQTQPLTSSKNEPKECQICAMALKLGQAGTVACSKDKHERLEVLVDL
jgi:hypothetical protein